MPTGYALNLVVTINNVDTVTTLCVASNESKILEVKGVVDVALAAHDFHAAPEAITQAVKDAVNGKTAVVPAVIIPLESDVVFCQVQTLPYIV